MSFVGSIVVGVSTLGCCIVVVVVVVVVRGVGGRGVGGRGVGGRGGGGRGGGGRGGSAVRSMIAVDVDLEVDGGSRRGLTVLAPPPST